MNIEDYIEDYNQANNNDENNKLSIIDNYINSESNIINIYNIYNSLSNKINYENEFKDENNKEFLNYIFKHCKYLLSYDNKKIIFDLQRIGNINNIFNNLKNVNKKIFKKLEYKIHRTKILIVLDKFMYLMPTKGFCCDFINYNYIIYDLKDNTTIKNSNDTNSKNTNCNEIYFIKMKYIVNKSEGKTHILFLLHNNNLMYNIY